ncbi:tetratricopeptide repeat protein [Novispirillum sp. DQ9]|uniref:tetratricopeptide repeat protein n=1 Tax=Novispirillum sp. DQ9 TaxID=3398612 RepID=UPI003C7C912C
MPQDSPSPERAAAAAIDRGIESLRVGRLEDARAALEDALSHAPRHADALHLLGLVAHHQGDGAAAERHLRAALANRPAEAAILTDLGVVLVAGGRLDDAAGVLARAVEADPSFTHAARHLGETLLALGRAEEALTALMGAARHLAGDADVFAAVGDCYRALGSVGQAERAYTAALMRDPAHARAQAGRAALPSPEDGDDDLLARLEEAAAATPDDAGVQAALAAELETAGRLEEAAEAARRALAVMPHAPAAHMALVRLAVRRKDLVTARRHLDALRGHIDPTTLAALAATLGGGSQAS